MNDLLKKYDRAYFDEDKPIVSDGEYDFLKNEIQIIYSQYINSIATKSSFKTNIPTRSKGSTITNSTTKSMAHIYQGSNDAGMHSRTITN